MLNFRSSGNAVLDDTRQAAAEGVVDLEEIGDDPVDLSELLADDALLDVLGGTDPDIGSRTSGDEGSDLESMLVAWRQDVDAAPIADLVDIDMAAAAITEGSRPRRRLKRRHLVPVASAAAVLMIAFTGFGLAARDAQPGDALWGVAQVLYIDHARAAQARESAEGDLQFAAGAWEQGNRSAAEAALKRAREQMQDVDAEHGLDELEAAHASLTAKFDKHEDTTESSTTEESASSEDSVTSTPPPPPQPPLPPEPPDTTSTQPPSSSTEPSESTTSPSETSGSSENPSSGAWGSENPFLPD
ncbi:anti-sigma-D factor RsdA [Parasphingorhabdus pacifica]